MSDDKKTRFDSSLAAQLNRVSQLTEQLSLMAEIRPSDEFISTMARLAAEQLLAYLARDREAYDRIQAEGSEVTRVQLDKTLSAMNAKLTE